MRHVIPLNYGWKYSESFCEAFLERDFDEEGFEEVDLPHTNKELPYNCFDEADYQFVSCYRKHLEIPAHHRGKRILIDFEGVMCYAEVYVNGHLAGEHKGGYTPFSIDITDWVEFGGDNVLAVKVDSTERSDIPPFGNVVDYLTYGGIYREVGLRIVNPVYIENAFISPTRVLEQARGLSAKVFLRNPLRQGASVEMGIVLRDGDTVLAEQRKAVTVQESERSVVELGVEGISGVELWDLDNPKLYSCQVLLYEGGGVHDGGDAPVSNRVCYSGQGPDGGLAPGNGRAHGSAVLDEVEYRIGFREAQVRPDGFFLNGKRVQLRGLNRHQSFPYVGYAMPKRVQRRDAEILKNELSLNAVRTSHYPQSRHFLDRCDEIGLLVFEELPGWQHIGDSEWKQVACQELSAMIRRDWNRPSIFLWGVRINESPDDHDFYTETNRIARELDPTRQTGGVRWMERGELLEDVYTMNDFIHSGGEAVLRDPVKVTGGPEPVPYIVTEFNGHMYPTKRFDQEERLIEQAMRHIRVQNAAASHAHISGAFGWCAFDYNTHHEFGSGDRICYHGVMDMFRIPKFAAYAYGSQGDPRDRVVLEAATLWARGERSIGGVIPLVIFTNCDHVEFYADGTLVGRFYPASDEFPALPHPPVIIRENPKQFGEWGFRWPDGEIVGFVNGQQVARKAFAGNPVATRLEAVADSELLVPGETYDVTRVVYRVVDQVGNLTPYINEAIRLHIDGPGRIIGPDNPVLIGGCIAIWVRTTGRPGDQPGEIRLTACSSRFSPVETRIKVRSY
jgi:beta-galactosidase